MTSEEVSRALVEAADYVNWLLLIHDRVSADYQGEWSTDDAFRQARKDAKELLAEVQQLRKRLKEKLDEVDRLEGLLP